MDAGTSLGEQFAQALAEKDFERILSLFDPEVDFRGVTPRRFWKAENPQALVGDVLQTWFDDSDQIEALEKLETDAFADRERVGYRLRINNPEGHFLVEQQLYLSSDNGRITWMRSLCSGFRPVE